MKIKKVDDKPMVIHTKEKAKIHAHEPKGAKIKGSNIYTVERGPKVHDAKANEMDKKASAKLMLQKSAGGKRTYRKSTIHQSEAIFIRICQRMMMCQRNCRMISFTRCMRISERLKRTVFTTGWKMESTMRALRKDR